MKTSRLSDMKAGWFVGDFVPTCYPLSACEVACKYYKKGDSKRGMFIKWRRRLPSSPPAMS